MRMDFNGPLVNGYEFRIPPPARPGIDRPTLEKRDVELQTDVANVRLQAGVTGYRQRPVGFPVIGHHVERRVMTGAHTLDFPPRHLGSGLLRLNRKTVFLRSRHPLLHTGRLRGLQYRIGFQSVQFADLLANDLPH